MSKPSRHLHAKTAPLVGVLYALVVPRLQQVHRPADVHHGDDPVVVNAVRVRVVVPHTHEDVVEQGEEGQRDQRRRVVVEEGEVDGYRITVVALDLLCMSDRSNG